MAMQPYGVKVRLAVQHMHVYIVKQLVNLICTCGCRNGGGTYALPPNMSVYVSTRLCQGTH